MEDRLRAFMRKAGLGPVASEADWDAFIRRAHRDLFVHRAVVFSVAAVMAVAAAFGSYAVLRNGPSERRDTNPIQEPDRNGADVPVVPRRVSPDCPDAPEYRPGSPTGAVAYLRGDEVHVLDLGTNEDRALLRLRPGLASGRVRFSPDGRWVSVGPGLVVPATGGRVCAPLGADLLGGTEWTAEGELIGVTRGRLAIGAPDGDARFVPRRFDSLAVGDFTLDDARRYVAFDVHDAAGGHAEAIWAAGLYADTEPREIYALPGDDPSTLRVASFDPSGDAVLAFKSFGDSASISMDGETLLAVSLTEPGAPVEITEMLAHPDLLAGCGDRTIVTAGTDRFITNGTRLVSVSSPDFEPDPLNTEPGTSSFWASCDPDGRVATTTSPSRSESRIGTLPRHISIVISEGSRSLAGAVPDGYGHEYPLFSQDGSTLLVVERKQKPEGPAALVLLNPETGARTETGASLGRVTGTFGHYDYAEILDWYQP
jgi:hypothetical protein